MSREKQNLSAGSPSDQVETFKKMCRLLEVWRRNFLVDDWRHFSRLIPQQQYTHLMMIRFALPCNLSRIMAMAGLTSAGASLFVNKLVQKGVLIRTEDPDDRRNVVISLSPLAQEEISKIDNRLNAYIFRHFDSCTPEELETLEAASRIVCSKLRTAPEK